MKPVILTKQNFFSILPEQVVCFSFASGSAMGSPGEIILFLDDGRSFSENFCFGDFTLKDFYKIIPILKEITIFGEEEPNFYLLNSDWKFLFMGMHNYLIIRSLYYEHYISFLETFLDPKKIRTNEILFHWYNAMEIFLYERRDDSLR